MNLSSHGILAYGATALLAFGGVIALLTKADGRSRRIGRWLAAWGILALPAAVTTGMLAHCRHVWHAAEVDQVPPNLPWYRLERQATLSATSFDQSPVERHAWLGAAATVAAALAAAGYLRAGPRRRLRTLAGGAAVLTAGILVAAVTGTTITAPDNPIPLTWAVHAHALLTGLAVSAACVAVVIGLTRDTQPRRLRNAIVLAIVTLFLSIGAALFVTTGWQAGRMPALLRQSRDVAYLGTTVGAIVALDVMLWAAGRKRRRRMRSCAVVLGALLAAQLWLAALILYDGSYRGSPVWRFHRPFVQGAHE